MTRITILAFGTRGDVQPALALGRALAGREHQVRVVASAHFREWIEGQGLEAAPSRVNIQEVMSSAQGQQWVAEGTRPLRQIRLMQSLIDQHGQQMAADSWQASQDAGAIISSFTSDAYATAIAEKRGIPHFCLAMQPALFATRDGRALANAPLPDRISRINNWFSRLVIEPFPWRMLRSVTLDLREKLGLPPQTARENLAARQGALNLLAYSPLVVPQPADWPETVHTVGYFVLEEPSDWTPPEALEAFLSAGPPPVYVGFGSMTGPDPAGLTRLILKAIARAGQRAVLLSGWAGMGATPLPPDVLRLDEAPHNWLFPRMAAVVHHGGAGTTAAGLRAGVPNVIVPHLADQPFWGRRVHALGAGPPPIPRPQLTVEKLASAIRQAVATPEVRARAESLGKGLQGEDGLGRAITLIGAHLAQGH